MSFLSIDFETRSSVDLRKAGVDAYAEHEHTDVWVLAYAFDNEPVDAWFPGQTPPPRIVEHITAGGIVRAWNIAFEFAIWMHILMPRYGFPGLKPHQLECTMARAYALAFPGSLDACAPALGLKETKDKDGYRLMMQMATPTLAWRKSQSGPPQWIDDKAKLARLTAYCKQDVVVEREIAKRLAPLSAREKKVWQLDHRINQRGVRLDLAAINAAQKVIDAEQAHLNRQIQDATDARISATGQAGAITKWLRKQGVEVDNLRKDTVRDLLRNGDLDEQVKRVVELRQEGAKASTAKLKAMAASVSRDGRARGLLGYHVATTGRWAGRRVQPQNLPRPTLSAEDIAQVIDLLPQRYAADLIRLNFAPPLEAVASSLRSLIIPAPGKEFVGGDFSNIEGRALAWLAGERWKLDAFRLYDRKEGPDLYKLAYSRAFGVPVDKVSKDERQIGKVMELALGYQGGPGAFASMAANYDADIEEIARVTRDVAGDAFLDHLEWLATWKRTPQLYGMVKAFMSYNDWAALKYLVDRWRAAHPNVKAFWYDLQNAAMNAVQNKGEAFTVDSGSISFVSTGPILFAKLPSSRCLAYPYPRIGTEIDEETGEKVTGLRYYAWDGMRKAWCETAAYGGLLAENVTQAVARDILVDAMFRLEALGFPVVLHVHDEVLCEIPANNAVTTDEFARIMSDSDTWARGLPVAAEAWRGGRYGK